MKKLLLDVADGRTTAVRAIREISGAFNPDHAVELLAIICAITRLVEGDMTTEDFKSIFKLEET